MGVSRGEVSLGQGVTHRGSRPFPALLLPKLLQQLLHRLGRSGAGGTWGCARGVRGSPGCRGALKTPRTPPNAQASPRSPCLIQTLGGPPDLLRPLKPPCHNRARRDPQAPGPPPARQESPCRDITGIPIRHHSPPLAPPSSLGNPLRPRGENPAGRHREFPLSMKASVPLLPPRSPKGSADPSWLS